MRETVHHYPSVGSLVKKMLEINPELGVSEIMELIRLGTRTQNLTGSEFVSADVVDEAFVLRLARERVFRS